MQCPFVPGNADKVIVAMIDISKLGVNVQVSGFKGEGHSYIIDKKGNMLLHKESMEYIDFFQTFENMEFGDGYSFKAMKKDILSQKEGIAIYSNLGTEEYAYYRPLGFSGWTVISTVQEGIITEKTTNLTQELMIISMITLIVFLALFIIVCIQFLQLESKRQANQAKSVFLANMSHDMRTPMNAIIGMEEIAISHIEDRNMVSDCLNKIKISSKHLQGLINDVLDMSRIESGKMVLNEDKVYLPEIINSLVNMTYQLILNKGQEFSIHLHGVVHEYFWGDNLRISQIFHNILSNAIKFTPKGGKITIDIEELQKESERSAKFRVTFTDNGIGMKQEFVKNIFSPFTRERDSKVDKIEGSGLGMSITKRIVDLMNGTIEVETEEGKGTTFYVTFSLPIDNSIQKENLPDCRVLIVNGKEMERTETMRALERLPVKAESAKDEGEMIAYIERILKEKKNYQAVFLDKDIYNKNLMEEIKKLNFDLGTIVICAYDYEEIHKEALEFGIKRFIQKPLFESVLKSCLQEVLNMKKLSIEAIQEKKKEFDFSGRNIFVAEDNELNREVAVSLLSETGACITCAEDGEECVQLFSESKDGFFDLILMDIQMPRKNGYEATKEIRKMLREDASVPILAMSANAFKEDMDAAKEAGMDGYLVKPIDINKWKSELERYIGND